MTPPSKIDALSQIAQPYGVASEAQVSLFESAMAEADAWHRARNPAYAALWIGLERPLLPIGLLKRPELATPVEGDGLWLSSSGTSGRGAAAVQFDASSLARIEAGMLQIFVQAGMVSQQPAHFLLLSPDPRSGPQPGYATSFQRFTACAPNLDVVFAVDQQGRFQQEVAWAALQRWAQGKAPVFVFGLTVFFEQLALSWSHVALDFRVPVKGITGGGWKGMTQGLDRQAILQRLQTAFGAQSVVDIRDIFGMTEHPLHYLSCTAQRFHIPHYSRCTVLDAAGAPAADGELGLIRLQNPFFQTLPSHDLLTEDMGRMGVGCGCGSALPWLEFVGRAGPSDITCAALATTAFGKA